MCRRASRLSIVVVAVVVVFVVARSEQVSVLPSSDCGLYFFQSLGIGARRGMEESDPDPAVAAGQRSNLIIDNSLPPGAAVNAECSSGMEIEVAAAWKGTSSSTGPSSPHHSSSSSSSSSSVAAARTTISKCSTKNENVKVYVKRKSRDAGGGLHLFESPLKKQNVDSLALGGSNKDVAVMEEPLKATPTSKASLLKAAVVSETSHEMVVHDNNNNNSTQNVSSNNQMENDVLPKRMMSSPLSVCTTLAEQPRLSKERNPAMTGELPPPGVTTEPTLGSSAEVEIERSVVELMTTTVKGEEEEEQPSSSTTTAGGLIQPECTDVTVTLETSKVEAGSACVVTNEQAAASNGPSKPVVAPAVIVTEDDDDQAAVSNGTSEVEQITAEFFQHPTTTLRVEEAASSVECPQSEDKPPVLLGSCENVHADSQEVGLIRSSEVENATVHPETSNVVAAASFTVVTDGQAAATNDPSEIMLVTAAEVDQCRPITTLGIDEEASAPVESMELEAKVPALMDSAENAHGDLQEAALGALQEAALVQSEFQRVGLFPESSKAVADALAPTDTLTAALNSSSGIRAVAAEEDRQAATSTLGIKEVSAAVDCMRGEAELPGLVSPSENVQGEESHEASIVQVESKKGGAAHPEANRPAAAPLVVAPDGRLAPADGQLAPTNGQAAPTDGQLTPTDGQLAPADGQLAPANGRATLANGQVAPATAQASVANGHSKRYVGTAEEDDHCAATSHGEEAQEANNIQAELDKVAVLSEASRPTTDPLVMTDARVAPANHHSETKSVTAEADQGCAASTLETAGMRADPVIDCMEWEANLPGLTSSLCENVRGEESREASRRQSELEETVRLSEEADKPVADPLLVAASSGPPSEIGLATGQADHGGASSDLQTEEEEEEVSAAVDCKQSEAKLQALAAGSCENVYSGSQEEGSRMRTVANSEILEDEGACNAAAVVSPPAKPDVLLSTPPKAKRTPLMFWPLETHAPSNHHIAASGISNSITSPGSPVMSNLGSPFLPARRSPLPIPVARPPPSSSNSESFQPLGSMENLAKQQQSTLLQGEERRWGDRSRTGLQTSASDEEATGRQGFVWQGKEEPDIIADIELGEDTTYADEEEGEESESAISEENVRIENPLLVGVRSAFKDCDPAIPGVCSQNLMEEENGHMMSEEEEEEEEEEVDNMDVVYEEEVMMMMTQQESPICLGESPPPLPAVRQLSNRTTSLLVRSETPETGGTSITQFSELYPNHEGISSVRRVRSVRRSSLCSKCMVLKKGHHKCPLETRTADGDASLERQDSALEVSGPPVGHPSPPPPPQQSTRLKVRLRVKPPVEDTLKETPITAKQLLATGLLEGHHVRYVGRGGDVMLTGIIRGAGVQCDCSDCRGLQVINVSAFEKHAGSSNRHPSDFIFIENGKCLRDILKAGWNAGEKKLNVLEVMKTAVGEIGGSNTRKRKTSSCFKCGLRDGRLLSCARGGCSNTFHQDCVGTLASDQLCPKCESAEKTTKASLDKRSIAVVAAAAAEEPVQMVTRVENTKEPVTNSSTKDPVTSSSTKEPVTSSAKEPVSSSSREPASTDEGSTHKISEPSFYKALFLPGGIPDDTEVGYYVKGQCLLTGVKKGAGIYCTCCQQTISCRLFEQHAGWASRCNPYGRIYLADDGRSLHLAAQSLMGQQKLKKLGIAPRSVESAVYCNEFGDGGELLLCTSCPRSYHEDCVGSRSAPPAGDWYCSQCQQQQAGISESKDDAAVTEDTKKTGDIVTDTRAARCCTRLLKVPEGYTIGRCVLCKSVEFDKSGFGRMTILLCYQCEQEYHVGCLKELGLADLTELPEGDWFCGQDCKHIRSILSLLVSNGPEPVADSIVGQVLERKQQQQEDDSSRNVDSREKKPSFFEWQLLHGRRGDPTNGRTLAKAVEIFRESFSMILDERPRDDLIPFMVYSRNCRDQEYAGMYCVVLKHNDKVVSAALVRIFGRQLAEVPLLATSFEDQGQGNCKALMLSIERLLGVLHVKRLVLPAAKGAEDIWLTKFGFAQISELQLQKLTFNVPITTFSGSSILGKNITPLAID